MPIEGLAWQGDQPISVLSRYLFEKVLNPFDSTHICSAYVVDAGVQNFVHLMR